MSVGLRGAKPNATLAAVGVFPAETLRVRVASRRNSRASNQPTKNSTFQAGWGLYQGGVFRDFDFEVAEILVGDKLGTLTVTSDHMADWVFDGGGVVEITALSPSLQSGGGLYSILNPCGDRLVDALIFRSINVTGEDNYRYSDSSIAGISTVPEPALVLALGVVGAALLGSCCRKNPE